MAPQWDEEQKLEEIMERRRVEGSSLQLDATQRVLELVENEHMLQSKRMISHTVKKRIPGWSIEQMKEKTNAAVVEGNVPVLGNFGDKNERRSHGKVQGRRWKERGLQR